MKLLRERAEPNSTNNHGGEPASLAAEKSHLRTLEIPV
jgi:hypothetical protein